MSSQKYKVKSTEEFAEEFKGKVGAFSRTLRGLEDRAKKCESLKSLEKESTKTISYEGGDKKYMLDWQPYLNDCKRRLSRSLEKLKEIQSHRKQRKISFMGSIREALPSWSKKKTSKHILLYQLINDTEDCQNLLMDIVNQIKPADGLTSLVNKIFQEQDSNQNDEITKDLEGITMRWNSLCQNVINKSGSLESVGLEVDREYKKLNKWYEKYDTLNTWLYFNEKVLDEKKPESTIAIIKEHLEKNQDQLKNVKDRKPNLEEVTQEADSLSESGRLDVGDAERVERYKEELDTRYTALTDRILGAQNRLYSSMDELRKSPQEVVEKTETTETTIVEASLEPNHNPPPKIISPFHREDETKSNEQKVQDSMTAVKKTISQEDRWILRTRTEGGKERIHEETMKAFDSSLDVCWKSLNDLDEESLQKFSAVGSNIKEVREQLDEIQDLEQKMSKEDALFRSVKETFEATEDKNLMKQEVRDRLQRKVDDLNSRWEEMWRSHDVNKDRLVQAILIMGGQWMGRVNENLDDLEEDINSIDIKDGDWQSLRNSEQKHKEIMDKIGSYEVSVGGAVDVAREVQRRDLVTEETGETITHETGELEDRLERLKAEAEDKKKRISESLRKIEHSTAVQEVMIPSSVSVAHSAPDQINGDSDEGFVEPKRHFLQRKVTYESLITKKMKELKKESKAINQWIDETEKLVGSLRIDMEPKKASRVQQKINAQLEGVDGKQSKVNRVIQLSKEIENETIDPNVSEPFVKEAKALKERWAKNKDLLENHGERDAASKASSGNCCILFLKKRLLPVWSVN